MLTFFSGTFLSCCSPFDYEKVEREENCGVLEFFKPSLLIKEQNQKDKDVLKKMRNLFFEADVGDRKAQEKSVREKAINQYGAQPISVVTTDNYRISGLWVERENAPINIVYVNGYFHDLTPPKEWDLSFLEVFPKYNIFSFDWRGFGQSEGVNGLVKKNSFGTNAFPDVQAVLKWVRAQNDKPIVLHGFCFGGAMAMYTTLKSKQENQKVSKSSKGAEVILPDALGFSCMFTEFDNLFSRAFKLEDRWFYLFLMQLGIGQSVLDYMTNGSLFDLRPVEMVRKITDIPCWFDHPTQDKGAVLEEAVQVYNAAKCPKLFLQSHVGQHVRIHSKAPYQYRCAYEKFLMDNSLISEFSDEKMSENIQEMQENLKGYKPQATKLDK